MEIMENRCPSIEAIFIEASAMPTTGFDASSLTASRFGSSWQAITNPST